jgi:hypothetical protein
MITVKTPSKPPLFSQALAQALLLELLKKKTLPQKVKSEAAKFLIDIPPSKRDEAWAIDVEMFLKINQSEFSNDSKSKVPPA